MIISVSIFYILIENEHSNDQPSLFHLILISLSLALTSFMLIVILLTFRLSVFE